jgi:DNA-binding XRE family transcriptional regulator
MPKQRDWLIQYRIEKNLTRAKAAEIFNLHCDTFRKYETGERTPKHQVCKAIAKYFGFDWTRWHE